MIRKVGSLRKRDYDTNQSAFRFYPTRGFPFYTRPVRIETEAGMTGALVNQLLDAEQLGPQLAVQRVQQLGQRRVQGKLVAAAAWRCPLRSLVGQRRELAALPKRQGVGDRRPSKEVSVVAEPLPDEGVQ